MRYFHSFVTIPFLAIWRCTRKATTYLVLFNRYMVCYWSLAIYMHSFRLHFARNILGIHHSAATVTTPTPTNIHTSNRSRSIYLQIYLWTPYSRRIPKVPSDVVALPCCYRRLHFAFLYLGQVENPLGWVSSVEKREVE